MIDAATLQAFAAARAMLLAGLAAICGWVYWHISGMERRMNARMDRIEDRMVRMIEQMVRMEEHFTDRMVRMEERFTARMDRMSEQMERMEERSTEQMVRMEQRLAERMDQQHREVLSLLEGHIHADGSPAVFRRVTPAADG